MRVTKADTGNEGPERARFERARFRVVHHDTTATSMRDARALLEADPTRPVVVRADVQTAAVGRLGRPWSAPRGGLWFTAAFGVDRLDAAGPCAILAGLATIRAVESIGLAPGRARLRWPNDVLVGGDKLSGVLCETFRLEPGSGRAAHGVLVGVGINANLRAADLPGGLRTPPTTLLEILGEPIDADALLGEWLGAFAAGLERLRDGALHPDDLDAAQQHLAWRGERVSVTGGGTPVSGLLLGLDPGGGARLLDAARGEVVTLRSGELSVRADPETASPGSQTGAKVDVRMTASAGDAGDPAGGAPPDGRHG